MKELVGRYVCEVRIGKAARLIVFSVQPNQRTGMEFLAYQTEGDCCSESWFSAINGIDALIGQTVVRVIEKDEVEADGTHQERDILYGYTLVTERGHCDIEFRNSSNGYYGGSCYLTDFDPGEQNENWAALMEVTQRYALI